MSPPSKSDESPLSGPVLAGAFGFGYFSRDVVTDYYERLLAALPHQTLERLHFSLARQVDRLHQWAKQSEQGYFREARYQLHFPKSRLILGRPVRLLNDATGV